MVKTGYMNNKISFIDIADAKLAYKTYGNGEPLVLCTGYASNMDLWSEKLIKILEKEFLVIIFDYRGMGLSTNNLSSFTLDRLAEDLKELICNIGLKKVSVLGWSMGSFVAQLLAIKFPDIVKKLIVYAGNCGGKTAIQPDDEIVKILTNPGAKSIDLLGTLFPDNWLKKNPEPWKLIPKSTEPYNLETINIQYSAIQKWIENGGGSEKELKYLKMPALIISGIDDKVVPSKNSIILSEIIPDSKLVLIENSGHGLMYQEPEIFAEKIISFLDI